MTVESWMFVALLIVTGVWVEFRARRAYKQGWQAGVNKAAEEVADAIVADRYFPTNLAVTLVYQTLIDKGLIHVVKEADREIIHGHLGSRVPSEELALATIKERFFRDILVSKNKWIKP